ncbi:PREDICTED: uncharacterized protein LOC105363036 [Ceratosolen solmsi marchali]|uniref:Uncharacterized protein LOC105363036 n=1 Tax=Ceratosolen solmsi marchali TaxID=326594 RepID=A0AAJ6YIY0_9HYME|nr:PREDICTED: uncharacterized protein LOC105363036 [Ceratosolen solmsi marchali]
MVEFNYKLKKNNMQGTTENTASFIEIGKLNNSASQEEIKNEYEEQISLYKNPFIYFTNSANEREEDNENYEVEDHEFSLIKYIPTASPLIVAQHEQRKELLAKLNVLHSESNVLTIKNKFLHREYGKLIRKSPSWNNVFDLFEESLIFEDIRYQQALNIYGQIKNEIDQNKASLSTKLENLRADYSLSETNYNKNLAILMTKEATIGKKIVPRKWSKQAWHVKVDQMIENQQRQMINVAKIRLVYIQLHYKLEQALLKLRELDNFSPRFSMMDYEILLKKKEINNDKRNEQYESIIKTSINNLFCTATIKHVDEELNLFNEKVKNEYDNLKAISQDNEIKHYKIIEMVKKRRTTLKHITQLRENAGLIENTFLLKKMQLDLLEITKLQNEANDIQSKILRDQEAVMSRIY